MSYENKVKVVRGWRRSWHHLYKTKLQERTDETLKDTDAVDMKILDMLKVLASFLKDSLDMDNRLDFLITLIIWCKRKECVF